MQLVTTLVLSLATFASIAQADDHWQAPEGVSLTEVTSAGTGCQGGAQGAVTLENATQLAIDFDAMGAVVGPGVPFTDRRKSCQYLISLDVPAGWTYAVDAVFGRGFAHIGQGLEGDIVFSTYFQGQEPTTVFSRTLSGPIDGTRHLFQSIESDNYAPCDATRALIFKGEVRLRSNDADAQGALALAGPVNLFLKWRRCD